jgi:hypothetical protein
MFAVIDGERFGLQDSAWPLPDIGGCSMIAENMPVVN